MALTVDESAAVAGAEAWLYAVGDVNGRALLTHQGKYQARIAGNAIVARAAGARRLDAAPWGEHAATADHHAVPQVVFTDPEVAAVGLTAAQASAAGIAVRPSRSTSRSRGRRCTPTGTPVGAVMVVDSGRDVLVGVTFVGQDVAELVHAATIAIVGEVPLVAALARGAGVPDDQRGVAAPAGDLPGRVIPGPVRP